jgi:hypothetical protein
MVFVVRIEMWSWKKNTVSFPKEFTRPRFQHKRCKIFVPQVPIMHMCIPGGGSISTGRSVLGAFFAILSSFFFSGHQKRQMRPHTFEGY